MDINLTELKEKIKLYGLNVIMEKMSLKDAEDFYKFMELLLEIGVIPSDFKSLIEDGNAILSESFHWYYTKEGGKDRVKTYIFTMHDYDDTLQWNNVGLTITPGFSNTKDIFTNENFVNEKLEGMKVLLECKTKVEQGGLYE